MGTSTSRVFIEAPRETVWAVEPPERLRYTVDTTRPGADVADVADEVTMTYSLEGRDGGTVLTIVQEDPRDVVPDTVDDEQAAQVLAALKAYAEAAGPPSPSS